MNTLKDMKDFCDYLLNCEVQELHLNIKKRFRRNKIKKVVNEPVDLIVDAIIQKQYDIYKSQVS